MPYDYQHELLDLANVVGSAVDPTTGTVEVYVTRKKPISELDEKDVVPETIDRGQQFETDVVETGLDDDADGFRPHGADPAEDATEPAPDSAPPRERHRPIPAGVSEHHFEGGGATGGPLAVVRDESQLDAAPGSIVRLSNNHVYARRNQATVGDQILQPAPLDGGSSADAVGQYCGSVPLENNVRVDAAARTTTEEDLLSIHDLPDEWPTGVVPIDGNLIGETVRKSGRTTGVDEAAVTGIEGVVNVTYGDPLGTLTITDCIITGDISEPGDSGSAVCHTGTGGLVGLLFAGSDTRTIVCSAENVEADLGVDIMATEDTEPEPEPEPEPTPDEPSFTETIRVEMEPPHATFHGWELVSDPPSAGEQFELAITVGSNYPTPLEIGVASDVDAATETVDFLPDDRQADGAYKRTFTVTLTAPDRYDPEGAVVEIAGRVADTADTQA